MLYGGMAAARQAGMEEISGHAERAVANVSVNFAFDVKSIRAEQMMRAIAFYVGGIENLELLDVLKTALVESIRQGHTFNQFRDAADEAFERFGVTPVKRHHIELVYRNNLQTAYNAGRYDEMTSPLMKSEFPLWEYNAINDGDTRPSHRAMDGRRYRPDNPIWDTWYPPNGHNCRCSVSMISADEVAEENLTEDNDVPGQPDRGFESNPAKDLKPVREWAEEKVAKIEKPFNLEEKIKEFEKLENEIKETFKKGNMAALDGLNRKLDKLKAEIAEKEKIFPGWRYGQKIDQDNFYISTIAKFDSIDKPDGPSDFESKSGSRYWYTKDGVIREADHWYRNVASCDWYIDDIDVSEKELKYGFCKWENFIPKDYSYHDLTRKKIPQYDRFYKNLEDIEKRRESTP